MSFSWDIPPFWFLAALLASVMSSCDSVMVAASGLFTENVYRHVKPDKDQRHYLKVGRFASLAVVAGGVLFAYSMEDVVKALETVWKITPLMGIAFWLGIFWRRATSAGAWAATLTAFVVVILVNQGFFAEWLGRFPGMESSGIVKVDGDERSIYLPWQMVFYLTSGLIAGVVVSLFTKPTDNERLDHYYALIRTPVLPGEKLEGSCVFPEGVEPAPRRVFFANSSFELPVPTRMSVGGFLAGWVLVGLIIAFVFWIAA